MTKITTEADLMCQKVLFCKGAFQTGVTFYKLRMFNI